MNCIVNVTERWGIGMEGRLAVSIRADLHRFRDLTMGHTVVLGRRTLATFPGGRPLKNRQNIILTHDENFAVESAMVFHDVDAVLAYAREKGHEDLWVIGGESVYDQLVPYCRMAYVTKTLADVPVDAYFPDLDRLPNWSVCEEAPVEEEDGVRYQFVNYRNSSPLEV